MLAKWLGLLQGTGRSRDRFRVWTWEFSIFGERTGRPVLRADLKPKIFLGTSFRNELPKEPLLLGNKTTNYLLDLLRVLDTFAIKLTAAASTPQGSPLVDVQAAASELNTNLRRFYINIEKLSSKSTYTI